MSSEIMDIRVKSLLRELLMNFPEAPFGGQVTPVDGRFDGELDEEKDLYENLRDQRWSDIPPKFIHAHPDGLVLLTVAAFVTFLPAWLRQAIDFSTGSTVRQALVYTFSSKHDLVPNMTAHLALRLNILSSEQSQTLHSVVQAIAQFDASADIRRHAVSAATFIKEVESGRVRRV